DLPELRLPFARQLGALQAPVPDQRYEVAAQIGRAEGFLLARDVAPGEERLDDRRPRRRGAQAPLLQRLLELLVVDELPGRLHRPEEGALGVGLRRGRLALADGRLVRAALAGAEVGEFLLLLLRVLLPPRVQGRPARLDHSDAPGPERDSVRDPGDARDLLQAGGREGGDQADEDRIVDPLAPR